MVYAPSVCTGPRSRRYESDPLDWDGAAIAIGDKVRVKGEPHSQGRYVIAICSDDPSWITLSSFKRSTTGYQVRACDVVHVL